MVISTLLPPGNVVKELELYKRRIFSLHGTISSLALPVFSLYHRAAVGETLKDPKALCLRGGGTGEVFSQGGALYLRLEGLDSFPGADEGSGGVGEFPGELDSPHLFLMAWDREGFSKSPGLPAIPRFSWRRWEHRSYEVCFAALPRWWERVFLYELPPRGCHRRN